MIPTGNEGDPYLHSPVGREQHELQQFHSERGLLVSGHTSFCPPTDSLFWTADWTPQ